MIPSYIIKGYKVKLFKYIYHTQYYVKKRSLDIDGGNYETSFFLVIRQEYD